ncbi:MAG: hypothetical protein GZ088_09880 [Acidipila sp.]|nr:hypothetical protein [Acidipila sp.]
MIIAKILLGTAVLGGAVAMQDGIVTVNVREKHPGGHHIWVAAPGVLVPLGLKFAPRHELEEQMRCSREWLPVVHAALRELQKSPDAIFVEVQTAREHVLVQKSWGRIQVDVDTDDAEVHVAVPLRTAQHALAELEELQPAS